MERRVCLCDRHRHPFRNFISPVDYRSLTGPRPRARLSRVRFHHVTIDPTDSDHNDPICPNLFTRKQTFAMQNEMSTSGQKQTYAAQSAMSALPPKADMCSATRHVRFGPKADSCSAANSVFIHLFARLPARSRW